MRRIKHIHLESQYASILLLLIVEADPRQTAKLPTEPTGNTHLESKLMAGSLVSFEVSVPFTIADYGWYTAKTSRSRNKGIVPIDRPSSKICRWVVKGFDFDPEKLVDEDVFVIKTADLSHARLCIAAAVYDLRRRTDGVPVDGKMQSHRA